MKRGLFFSMTLGLVLCLGVILQCLNTPRIDASDATPLASLNQTTFEAIDPAVSGGLMPVRVDLEGQLGGPVNSLAVSGSLAFVGTGYYLQIIDLADLEQPKARGSVRPFTELPFSNTVRDIELVGDTAYVVSYGLQIIDGSNADRPQILGKYYHSNTYCREVDVQGSYAYLACDFSSLVIVDISNPWNPQRVGTLLLDKSFGNIVVSGDYAYLDAGSEGVLVIDVSDPTAPIEADNYQSHVAQLSLGGQYLYLTRGKRLHVVDISNPTSPQEVGLCEVDSFVDAVAVSDGMAFVAGSVSVLHMIDVRQPEAPVEIAYFDTMSIEGNMGFDRSIAVFENTVYFADAAGIWVIDAGQVSPPVQAGAYDTPGSAVGVAKQDDLLYVADDESGLRILDVSTPASINEVGYLDTPGRSQDVAISGTIAYVALGEAGGSDVEEAGLAIVDVSAPGSPAEMGVYDQVSNATDLAIAHNMAFLAGGWSIPIIDVSIPMSPTLIGRYDDHCSSSYDVVVVEELLLASCGYDGLHLVNISTPDQPSHLSTVPMVSGYAQLAVSGSIAYALSDSRLVVVDISAPLTPTVLGRVDLPNIERSHDLVVAGNRAYLVTGKNNYPAEGKQGLRVIDVSNPGQMHEVGWFETGADTFGVTYDSGLVYLGAGESGVEIVDVSQANGLMEIGRYGLPPWTIAVAVDNDYAYVVDYSYGFKVIDVSQPSSPNWVGSLDENLAESDIVISGDYAYVAERKGLRVIDISYPPQPAQIGLFDMDVLYDDAHAVVLSGTVAYVAGNDGLYIVDISDPAQPEQLALYNGSGGIWRLALSGNYIYALESALESDFVVLDISTPEAPLEVGSVALRGHSVAVSGTHAYVAGNSRLSIVDISDASSPKVVGEHNVPGAGQGVAIFDPYVLVTDSYWLRVIDVSDPTTPKEVGNYNTSDNGQMITVAGGLVYMAVDDSGLMILSLEEVEFSYSHLPLVIGRE